MSDRSYAEHPQPWDYGPGAVTRKLYTPGMISYQGREYRISKAFRGQRVGLRPLSEDGLIGVYYCRTKIHEINLREEK